MTEFFTVFRVGYFESRVYVMCSHIDEHFKCLIFKRNCVHAEQCNARTIKFQQCIW